MPLPRINRRQQINRMFRVDDVVVASNPNTTNTTVSLTVLGEPISQPRPTSYSHPTLRRVIVFDSAKYEKLAFKRNVRAALADVGVSTFPFFQDGKLKVTATFYFIDTKKTSITC